MRYRRAGQAVSALQDVTLQIAPGEAVALLGANGSGKSTLLLALRGLVRPDNGAVLGPARPSGGAGGVTLLLQRPESAFFGESVRDDLTFGPELAGIAAHEREQLARAALASVGLGAEFLERDPLMLSGGEQRRVALAAALAMRPHALLLDEPTAGLDPRARARVLDCLRGVSGAGAALVLATHQLDDALAVCPRSVVLQQGRVVFDGPTLALVEDPALCERLAIAPRAAARLALQIERWTGRPRPERSWQPDIVAAYAQQARTAVQEAQ